MQRWHKVQAGRIVASCECATGEAAEVLLRPDDSAYVVSDADWRRTHWKRVFAGGRGRTIATRERRITAVNEARTRSARARRKLRTLKARMERNAQRAEQQGRDCHAAMIRGRAQLEVLAHKLLWRSNGVS